MQNTGNDFAFHATKIAEATALLNSNTEQGLSSEKAKEMLEQFGSNAIEEAKSLSALQILANQFKSPIVYLLFFAVAMSFWFKEWLDGIAILIVIIINTAIGFYM